MPGTVLGNDSEQDRYSTCPQDTYTLVEKTDKEKRQQRNKYRNFKL